MKCSVGGSLLLITDATSLGLPSVAYDLPLEANSPRTFLLQCVDHHNTT